jgi:hypothetical protein
MYKIWQIDNANMTRNTRKKDKRNDIILKTEKTARKNHNKYDEKEIKVGIERMEERERERMVEKWMRQTKKYRWERKKQTEKEVKNKIERDKQRKNWRVNLSRNK